MKFKINTVITLAAASVLTAVAFNNCSSGLTSTGASNNSSLSTSTTGTTDPTGGSGGVTTAPSTIVAGGGSTQSGTGASSVPTGAAIVARLTNGLAGSVSPLSGNYAKSFAQVSSNLPKSTDPTKATGFDQAQLLVYAACSDLTTGSVNMKAVYGVDPKLALSTAAVQTAIVAAGVKMIDAYTGGMASQSTASAAVSAALTTLVKQSAATTSNTTTIAFMTTCIAANSYGTVLLGN